VLILGLAAIYLVVGRLTFVLDSEPGNITSVPFAADGIALVAFIRFGPKMWFGAFLGQAGLALTTGTSIEASAAIGAVNASEGALGAYLFHRFGIDSRLEHPRDIIRLLGLSALILAPLSATGGIFSQVLFEDLGDPDRRWVYWWAANTLGQMLVAAPLLVWTSDGRRPSRRELREGLAVSFAYAVAVTILVAGDVLDSQAATRLACFIGLLLVLYWIAIRSEVATVVLCTLVVSVGLVVPANATPGVLALFDTADRLVYADLIILGSALSAWIVAALIGQLRVQVAALGRANSDQAKMFAVVGHDLRGPVNDVGLMLDVLTKESLDVAEARELATSMRTQISATAGTLDSLLEWGRAELGAYRPRPRALRVTEILTAASQRVEHAARSKEIRIRTLVDAEVRVVADPAQTESILRNLLTNAVKFTPRGGEVSVSAERDGAAWNLIVSDTGVGMSAEQLERVLGDDSFTSSPGTDGEAGAGVGLRIVTTLAEANEGTVAISSVAGVGTTVVVSLPVPLAG